jgi:hypothetical protein
LFVHDWGTGRPILFLSAWTLQSNVWGSHIATLTDRGFRCVALIQSMRIGRLADFVVLGCQYNREGTSSGQGAAQAG